MGGAYYSSASLHYAFSTVPSKSVHCACLQVSNESVYSIMCVLLCS